MTFIQRTISATLLVATMVPLLAGCGTPTTLPPGTPQAVSAPPAPAKPTPPTKADDIAFLVNKQHPLPAGYVPSDLVEPKVAFIFKEKDEKRMMRKDAAEALERLFAAAKQDGIYLGGVSGYRSFETQKALFNYYVKTQGEQTARKYSAEPGQSEHQTGLAMDVSGSTGVCAVEDCFADTAEGKWLVQHAAEHGFILRYAKGKESITGYNYEPWHIRYVGKAISTQVAASGQTLEEYFGQ